MATRDEIRAATVGSARHFKSDMVEWDGMEIEVRQPSVGARSEIIKKSMVPDTPHIDLLEMRLHAMVSCCFVPGTNDRVFEDTDLEAFRECEPGGFVDHVSDVVMQLMNVEKDERGVSKNSEATQAE